MTETTDPANEQAYSGRVVRCFARAASEAKRQTVDDQAGLLSFATRDDEE